MFATSFIPQRVRVRPDKPACLFLTPAGYTDYCHGNSNTSSVVLEGADNTPTGDAEESKISLPSSETSVSGFANRVESGQLWVAAFPFSSGSEPLRANAPPRAEREGCLPLRCRVTSTPRAPPCFEPTSRGAPPSGCGRCALRIVLDSQAAVLVSR